MRNLVLFATAGVAATALIGAILPVPRDGRGHPITEYTGVFQAPYDPSTFLSVIYYDGHLYAAQRSAGGRQCVIPSRAPGGMYFVNGWYDNPPRDLHPNASPRVFVSELNGLRESKSFWPRVADSANVWDMYAYDAHGQPKFCVPDGLVTPGSHSFSQGSPPAVINHPVAAPTRGP